jgi:hypothetical protein
MQLTSFSKQKLIRMHCRHNDNGGKGVCEGLVFDSYLRHGTDLIFITLAASWHLFLTQMQV